MSNPAHLDDDTDGADILGSISKEIGADPEVILKTSHGRRSIDTLKIIAPEKATMECEC